jgi:hypothetical protein
MRRLWRRFLAWTRIDLDAVCELSRGLSEDGDYHDYPDSVIGEPLHFYTHTCKRCGKRFTI